MDSENIKKKFQKYILAGIICKPKPHKMKFFKNKAEKSLNLARELLEKNEYLDWAINIAYYSMYYNAISLLAYKNIDIEQIDENTHLITYQALVFYFHIQNPIIEEQYIDDFRNSLDETNSRLQTLAKQKSNEIFSSYKNAKDQRGKITYELGKIAELSSAKTAIRRADSFEILTEKILFEG